MKSFTRLVSLLSAASTALSFQSPSIEQGRKVIPGAYIYEFADGHDNIALSRNLGLDGRVRMSFNSELFKGVSIQHDVENAEETAARIASKPEIKNVWPVHIYDRPKNEFQAADVASALTKRDQDTVAPHIMMGVDKLREKGITGKGIKIAVLDSGVDYKHPALGGCFGKGCLISFGYDLVGDAYNGGNQPMPKDDPMDCGSHGTHVTGIIAAQPNPQGFTGVAPAATMGMYKVFGCVGGVGTDVLIAATNMAVEAKPDIITASIGGDGGWTGDAWSELLTRVAEKKGIVSTVAAGNAGATGAFFPSGTSNSPGVIAIASFDNTESIAALSASSYKVDAGENTKFGYSPGDPKAWADVTLPLWTGNFDTTKVDDGCAPYPDNTPDLSGNVVLIRRGTCPFTQKATNAAAKGAKYILYYNNAAGTLSPSAPGVKGINAVGMVLAETAETWIKSLKDGKKVTVAMIDPAKAERYFVKGKNTATGGALSGFTSWGPTMEMNFKPQFGGPGGGILSTLPLKDGSYGTASGTSMATPMVAGVVALLKEIRGDMSPAFIKHLLSSTANAQLFNDGTKFYDYLAPTPQQGGGLVQADKAAYATAYLEPSSLSFNDTTHLARTLKFTIHNIGKASTAYHVSHVPATTFYTLAKGSIFPSRFPNDRVSAPADIRVNFPQVALSPGSSFTVEVTATPPKDVDTSRLALWSGYITVNGTDGSSLSIPYQGLAGEFNKAKTLPADAAFIAKSNDPKFNPVPADTKFVLPKAGTATLDDGIPVILGVTALGTKTMTVDVVSLADTAPKVVGQIAGTPASDITRGLAGFYWDGSLNNGSYVEKGKYKFTINALHIYGDISKKEDWDSSDSPNFSIEYKQ